MRVLAEMSTGESRGEGPRGYRFEEDCFDPVIVDPDGFYQRALGKIERTAPDLRTRQSSQKSRFFDALYGNRYAQKPGGNIAGSLLANDPFRNPEDAQLWLRYASPWLQNVFYAVCDDLLFNDIEKAKLEDVLRRVNGKLRGEGLPGIGMTTLLQILIKPVYCPNSQLDHHDKTDFFFVFHDPDELMKRVLAGREQYWRYANLERDTVVTVDATLDQGRKREAMREGGRCADLIISGEDGTVRSDINYANGENLSYSRVQTKTGEPLSAAWLQNRHGMTICDIMRLKRADRAIPQLPPDPRGQNLLRTDARHDAYRVMVGRIAPDDVRTHGNIEPTQRKLHSLLNDYLADDTSDRRSA